MTGTVLLADFGLSVIADVGNSFTETHGINALPWTSPELIKSGDDAQGVRPTFESDIYAYGCTCFEVSLRIALTQILLDFTT